MPPPGYVAYGGPGAVPQGTMPIAGISKALGILMLILVPFQALAVFSTFQISDSARDFINGSISESEFEDKYSNPLGQMAGFLMIPVAVLTIIWMFRMAKNIRALGRTDATFAPGWAIGGWFTPPCFLFAVPWLMFRELWKGSDPDAQAGLQNWKAGRVSPLINVWWVLYGLLPLAGLATSVSFFANFQDANSEDLADQFDKYATVNIALGVIAIASAIVYFLLVRQLSDRHMKATGEQQ